ncbi:hypothetical protein [Salinarimonas rosea]|uniref:hypothetical protein n=1 Tax=Salinarimonas rosea TaxID=552063 RepID=UPI0012EC86AC|nr:hypothetical protein [Salinarimonas rosea]
MVKLLERGGYEMFPHADLLLHDLCVENFLWQLVKDQYDDFSGKVKWSGGYECEGDDVTFVAKFDFETRKDAHLFRGEIKGKLCRGLISGALVR